MLGRPSERSILERFNLKKGETVLDAGANIGWYTLIMSRMVGKHGKVLAVEPDPSNFTVLERNIKDNSLENVSAFQVALSDRDGYSIMSIAKLPTQHSLVESIDKARLQTVKTMKLDTLLKTAKTARLDFAKVDVEGAEMQLLKGASVTLDSKPEMIIESSKDAGADRFLQKLGYDVTWIDQNNVHAKKI